jgi:hypothetical protein
VEHPPGWPCELILVRLELYLLGTLSRIEALAVAEHVETCHGCAHRLVLSLPLGSARRG